MAAIKTIKIKALPKSSLNKVIELGHDEYKIKTQAQAVDGEANRSIIALLAAHLKIKKRQIVLVHGEKSREKIFKIHGNK